MPLDLDNKTPFACEFAAMLAKNGANILRFVARATYDINPNGKLTLAAKQAPVRFEDVYWGEPGKSAVRYESDVSLDKPYTDLIVNGHAHAPNGRPTTSVLVGLKVDGRLVKHMRVTGDRHWHYGLMGWRSTDPKPFLTLPVTYDRAFGGMEPTACEARNRVGVGFASKVSPQLEGTPLPNVEFIDSALDSPTGAPRPAGLGVMGRDWKDRLKYAGTYDDQWLADKFPLLPDDFDDRFNQCAPEDQWMRGTGGQLIQIVGMRTDGSVGFTVPHGTVRLALHYRTRSLDEALRLDCVLVDCERLQVELTWRGNADTHGDPFQLNTMVVNTDSPELTNRDCEC